jgi:hypothetical protein
MEQHGQFGYRESGTARLEEAVPALSDALKEWTRERVPLPQATISRLAAPSPFEHATAAAL